VLSPWRRNYTAVLCGPEITTDPQSLENDNERVPKYTFVAF